ncbi:hypothetical protein MUG78_16045 [Gordonia alkaliphila]|uniref:hypothetical protein n=1 Tax=Gordonia alkaliphila TaxID=1053547 RepID=UPI001FF1072C|nr:hypothetical protein [Gordonia alkaliphila]MCK0440922.1 hypothetical protein [Gordonia alkaliphila]
MSSDSPAEDASDVTTDAPAKDSGTKDSGTKDGGTKDSGVAAKAARRAESAAPAASGGREFTISARALRAAGLALVAVAAVVAIAVLSWQVTAKSRTLSAFDDSKSAASSFVTTYFESMMAAGTTPEKIKAVVVPLTTGEARERVEADAGSTVQFFDEGKFSNLKVEVNSATVESFTDTSATTVVAATLTGTSPTLPAGGQQVVLLQLDLTKQDGKWLVGRMIVQPGISESSGQPAPAPAPAPAPQEGQPAG